MPFKRDSTGEILGRVYAKHSSRYKPLDKTPRHSLLKVFAAVDSGTYHKLLGDLDFLSKQMARSGGRRVPAGTLVKPDTAALRRSCGGGRYGDRASRLGGSGGACV
jgi:hypothetical protein